MKSIAARIFVILSFMVGFAARNATAITLVEDGAPRAVLIVEADAEKSMQAAVALQTYIEMMSGAALPLVMEGQPLPADAPPGRVHVGHTAAAQGQNVPSGFDPTIRDVENMAVNAPIYRDIGIKGLRREGRKAFMQTWISYYVTAKLLWDADTDVEALKQDFYPGIE